MKPLTRSLRILWQVQPEALAQYARATYGLSTEVLRNEY